MCIKGKTSPQPPAYSADLHGIAGYVGIGHLLIKVSIFKIDRCTARDNGQQGFSISGELIIIE